MVSNFPTISKSHLNHLKVAIYYDWLNQYGGAEKVLLDILQIFPQATLFTLFHEPKSTPWLPSSVPVVTSPLHRLFARFPHHPLLPSLYAPALESFDFSGYDIVISTTASVGHSLITPPQTLFHCHLHNPNRHLYSRPHQLLGPLLNLYRPLDQILISRPDSLSTNSVTVADRIHSIYHRQAKVIYPGIDTDLFRPSPHPKSDYFLVVSRLVNYKQTHQAIEACYQLNLPLRVVGTGRLSSQIQQQIAHLNHPQIKFLGQVDTPKLIKLYQNCTALICPQLEDYGLTPLEAMACGKPVIAFDQGGHTETVIHQQTGLLYSQQSTAHLAATLVQFPDYYLDPKTCRQQSLRFSRQNFVVNFTDHIMQLWQQHRIL